MPRKLPPHTDCFRDRHGKMRLYFRKRPGPRVPLPGTVGSEEFMAAYAAALAGEFTPKRVAKATAKDGTIAALITSYLRSSSFTGLRASTRKEYLTRFEVIRQKHGHRTVKGLTRERIVVAFLEPYAAQPGAALHMLVKLRILIRHAILLNWLQHDPSIGIKRPKTEEIRSWSEGEIAQYEARWPIGTKQRLAFALMLFTGQRRSDVHRMTWADIAGSTIRVVQQKTRAKLAIALHGDLRTVLGSTPRQHVAIIVTEAGKPYSVEGFSGFMRDAITAAGLPLDCQPHGLRKAAGRRLAEAGASARQIMAVLGHKSLSEAERYTRDAEQAGLAAGAVVLWEGHTRNSLSQTHPEKVGQIVENTEE